MTKIIGIDLGTSNSAAAVVMGGKPTIIPAAEGATVGGKAFPSGCYFAMVHLYLIQPTVFFQVLSVRNMVVQLRQS